MATGQQVIAEAVKHIGEKYILGALAPLSNPNHKGPWDCAEFVSWCIFKVAGIKVGVRNDDAYTGYWDEDAKTAKCTKISINSAAVTPGAILLRPPHFMNHSIGHIVFSDGNGGSVEAMDTKHGVTRGKISGRDWSTGLLVTGITYTESNKVSFAFEPPKFAFRVQTPLMQDSLVLAAKKILKAEGLNPGKMDTNYDVNMAAAITNYQIIKKLVVDGIMGTKTLRAMKLIN